METSSPSCVCVKMLLPVLPASLVHLMPCGGDGNICQQMALVVVFNLSGGLCFSNLRSKEK